MTNAFGGWIKQRRRALDLTQDELARQVGCSVITIQKLEAGARRPSQQMLGRLADYLQLSADERSGFLQLGRAQQREPDRPPGATAPIETLGAGLPRPLTPLIGRDRELALLSARIQRPDTRLLTCLGPAGVGKTRLSLEVAAGLQGAFRDGVAFVPLAPLRDPQLLPNGVAQALSLQINGPIPLDELATLLRGREQLLVLDNFEHIAAAAPAVAQLLQACPGLKVLATSRTRLRVRGERVLTLAPLALPDLSGQPDAEALAQAPAVALFCEFAQAADPAFQPTRDDLAAVAQICARLDGLPLAIEIVATRASALPPALLLEQIDQQLMLGAGGPHDLPARQRTLRAAFDWSYALLGAAERRCFEHLAVFAAGWTPDAAAAVCGDAEPAPQTELLGWLEALLDHSLIYRVDSGGRPGFALLEPIREYALERLAAHGGTERARQRHALHYLALAETAAPEMRGGRLHSWIEQLRGAHDNIRIALGWLISSAQPELAARLCVSMRRLWWAQGQLSEGLGWIARLKGSIETLPLPLRANLWYADGMLASALGALADAEASFRAGIGHAQAAGDLWVLGACASGLGVVLAEQQRYAEAQAFLEQGLEVDRQLGERNDMAVSLAGLAGLHYHQGSYARAGELFEECLAIHRELGDLHSIALILNNLGEVLRRQGRNKAAHGALSEALRLARQLNAQRLLPYLLNNFGTLACQQGDLAGARAALAEAIEGLGQTGDRSEIVTSALGAATLALRQEMPEQTARLLGAIEAAARSNAALLTPASRADLAALVATARALFGEAEFTEHSRAGGLLSLEQAIAEVLA
jgi:predicted ATPase/Tfp pilus assembly protein PilF/DNA-binding XRE family transcriptional regulator